MNENRKRKRLIRVPDEFDDLSLLDGGHEEPATPGHQRQRLQNYSYHSYGTRF